MDNFARLLLRLILIPVGYLAAVMAGSAVILIGEWRIGTLFEATQPDAAALGFVIAIVASATVLVVLLSLMWLVAAVGILFSEAFAVRSWMFHAANGVVSAWIGSQLFAPADGTPAVASDPFYVVAAGLAAGLAYWLVAGSTAGFFKPILRSPAERAGRLPSPPPQPELPPPAA
ncbi:hypothetical protein V5F41_18350 [Xanthobacter autotrophicus]|uniref:hypothetical protein n=1 Tax=Xanthobacter autotrophicus TaxID=280 RepID=UPI00372A37AC